MDIVTCTNVVSGLHTDMSFRFDYNKESVLLSTIGPFVVVILQQSLLYCSVLIKVTLFIKRLSMEYFQRYQCLKSNLYNPQSTRSHTLDINYIKKVQALPVSCYTASSICLVLIIVVKCCNNK